MNGEKPQIEIKLFANFREIVGEKGTKVTADTVGEVLEKLGDKYEDLGKEIFLNPEKGEIMDSVNILVNGRSIGALKGTDTKLKDEDTVAIFPPVAGVRNDLIQK